MAITLRRLLIVHSIGQITTRLTIGNTIQVFLSLNQKRKSFLDSILLRQESSQLSQKYLLVTKYITSDIEFFFSNLLSRIISLSESSISLRSASSFHSFLQSRNRYPEEPLYKISRYNIKLERVYNSINFRNIFNREGGLY